MSRSIHTTHASLAALKQRKFVSEADRSKAVERERSRLRRKRRIKKLVRRERQTTAPSGALTNPATVRIEVRDRGHKVWHALTVDDVRAVLDRLPTAARHGIERIRLVLGRAYCAEGEGPPHRLYNLGNNRAEPLPRFVEVLERACGRTAKIEHAPMQPGDVRETYADIAAATRDLGFRPAVTIGEGLPRFVAWYRARHRV